METRTLQMQTSLLNSTFIMKLFAVIFLYITRMVRKLVTATLQLLMHTNLNLMAMQRPLQLKELSDLKVHKDGHSTETASKATAADFETNMQKMLLVFQTRKLMEHMKSTTLHMYTLLLKTELVIQVLRQSY